MKRENGFELIDENVAPLFQTEMPHFLSRKILFSDLLLSHHAFGVNNVDIKSNCFTQNVSIIARSEIIIYLKNVWIICWISGRLLLLKPVLNKDMFSPRSNVYVHKNCSQRRQRVPQGMKLKKTLRVTQPRTRVWSSLHQHVVRLSYQNWEILINSIQSSL